MANRTTDLVRDYINLYILEKTGNTEGLEVPFQKKLSTKDLKTFNDDEAKTKEMIEETIQKLIDQQSPQELMKAETRAKVIDQVYDGLNPNLRTNFNQMINQNLQGLNRNAPAENFNANLILSEIFMPDENFGKGFLDEKVTKSGKEEPLEEDKDALDVSQLIKRTMEEKYTIAKFEREIQQLDFKNYNNKKLVGFLEMLDSYKFKLDFQLEDLEKSEGLILKFFYSDEQNLYFYIFKKSIRNFMRKFSSHFEADIQARFKAFDMVQSPHLTLLATYSPSICEFLDKQEYIEKVQEQIAAIPPAHYHLYIKILINFIDNYPFVIDKMISLKILDKLAEPILEKNLASDLSLFTVLLTKTSSAHINSKKLLSRATTKILFAKITELTHTYSDLKVLSLKCRNHITHFFPNSSEEPQVVLEAYIKEYKKLISQKMTMQRYRHLYYTGLLLLKFIATSTLRFDADQKAAFANTVIHFISVYFYQRNLINKGFVSLRKLMCKEILELILDEFFESNLLKNCFSVFERKSFSLKTIRALFNFQNLLLSIIETTHLAGKSLHSSQLKKIIDQVYGIRVVVSSFYYEMKKKYLSKGLIKYVQKLKKELKKNLVRPLDEVLSLNALIMQKLSHTQLLDENILYYTGVSETMFHRFKEKHRLENLISASNELLYIVSKVDRKEGYLEKVITYNLFMLDKIEDFVSGLQRGKEMVDFDLIESIIEYLIVNIYFVKTYDEQYKKVSSMKVLKRTVELFVRILESTRTFTDLQSNHQIYILLENLGLFWLLFFDYNYRFYDRLSFAFIDNLKTVFRETEDNKIETFLPTTLHKILTFLNDFVDLKSKNPFLNFIILRQLDTIHLTLTNITSMNMNLIVNIFQKVFSSEYGPELHRLHPKYIINMNIKTLSIPGIKEPFINFITKNILFVNQHTSALMKNLLEKNFEIESLKFDEANMGLLFAHTVLSQTLVSTPELTQFLLNLIQKNIRNKVLFEDLVAVLRKYLKTTDSAYNNEIVRKLFLSESVFLKLVRLYKKDRVNLSKVLKYLLLICKHFNFLKEIKIPRGVIVSLLNAQEIGLFHDVYMLVISYILDNNLYNDYKTEIDTFLTNTKTFLDSLLYFSTDINYDHQIRIIYYSLKAFKNCSAALKNIPEFAEIESEGFVLKYILQLMDENSKLEMVPINNLYHHFKKHQQINLNYKTANFERKIVMMFFHILQENPLIFDSLIQDFFVVNKLISFSYIVLDEKVFEKFAGLFIRILYFGIKETQKDLFKDVFFDFYLLVYFEFLYESETIEPFVQKHICENNKLINSALIRILEEVKRKKYRFDTMGYNMIIRSLLKVYYIICAFTSQVFVNDYSDILLALDGFLYHNYKDVHSLTKLEKLIVSLYIHIHGKAKLKSKNSASVFLYLFNNFVDFKMSSLIDRYIYMGLFNMYFKVEPVIIRHLLDKDSGEFSKLIDSAQIERLKTENSLCSIEPRKINEILLQLKLPKLSPDNEIILIKFLEKLTSINKTKVLELNYTTEIQTKIIKEIVIGMGSYDDLDQKSLILLKRRVNLLLVFISKEIASNLREPTQFLTEAGSLCGLIAKIYSSEKFPEKGREKFHIGFFIRLQKLLYKLYKLASSKNEAYLKPEIMQFMQQTWLAVEALDNLHESKKIFQNDILQRIVKLMRKRYDEMRIVLFKDFIPEILQTFKKYIETLPVPPKEPTPETNDNDNIFKPSTDLPDIIEETKDNILEPKEKDVHPSTLKVDIPDLFSDEYLESLTLDPQNFIFSSVADNGAILEKCLFIFYQISRNRLLLDMEFKKGIIVFIEENKVKLLNSNLLKILYKLIKVEYLDDGATLNLDASSIKHSVVTAPVPPETAVLRLSQNGSFKKISVPPKEFNGDPTPKIEPTKSLIKEEPKEKGAEKPEDPHASQVPPQTPAEDPKPPIIQSLIPLETKPPTQDKLEELSPLKSQVEDPKEPIEPKQGSNLKIQASVVVLKKPRESTLSAKQKNILYVHKVFVTLRKNLEKREVISPREEEYLSFGLVALQKHLLENLDPEIFNSLSFFSLICKFILDDRINTTFKFECLEILRLYLKSCQQKNGVNPEDTKGLLYFYERLFFDNYSEIVTIYFEVLLQIFQFIKFDQAFLNQYIDHMGFCLFEAYSSISANVFVPALSVYTRVIIDSRLQLDIPKISGTVYMFLKLNFKDMKLYERALFTQLLAVYDKNGGFDSTRLNNMCLFVKFSNTMEGYDRIEDALVCFEEITNFYEDFQKLFRVIGFEAFYKLVMKKCGENIQIIRLLSKLFLRYTYKAEDNKFEMFDIIKFILKYIPKYFNKSPQDEKSIETVILLYKSLVNCSLVKENSNFMVKSDLSGIIINCSYKGRAECVFVVLALLFNIGYVFDNGEINLKKLINDQLLEYISDVFEGALEQKNDVLLMEIIDLFLGFVQHEYTDFFTESIIYKIKLALNFYYDSSLITIKFLNILKDITINGDQRIVQLVSTHFDFIYLYHIHYRNFKNEKINFFVKHIICNCMIHNKEKQTQKELVTFGIPENVIHTFSLDNEKNVMILNLKIILMSLKFEKCQFFVKNHFMIGLKEILFGKKKNNEEQILKLALDILVALFEFFQDAELLNFNYYFTDIPMIFILMSLYGDNDSYMLLLLAILKNNIDKDKEKIEAISPANKMMLQEKLSSKAKSKNKDLSTNLYTICTLIELHASFVDRKMDFSRGNAISGDDRVMLENGQSVLVVFQNKVNKGPFIKFDFVKNNLSILNFPHKDPETNAASDLLCIKLAQIKAINAFSPKDENSLEDLLKSYFNKKVKRELFFSMEVCFGKADDFTSENMFVIFENEYKMQKWKNVLEILVNKK